MQFSKLLKETDEKEDEKSETLFEPNTIPENVKSSGIEPLVQQLDLPPSSELIACSSYDEYVQTLINWLPIQITVKAQNHLILINFNSYLQNFLKEMDDTEKEDEVPEFLFESNTALESVETNGLKPVISNRPKLSTKPKTVCYPSNSRNDKRELVVESSTSIILNGDNIVTVNYDLITKENLELKQENQKLKEELDNANKRNRLLQNYLVAADERASQTLFIEKVKGQTQKFPLNF